MSRVSRRSLAKYAADQLLAGTNVKKLSKNLSAVLAEDYKVAEYQLLVDDILWELEQRGELASATVTSAHELSANQQNQLKKNISSAAGVKDVVIETKVDKGLLGGIRVQTASHTWDHSLSAKLSELREAF